MRDTRIHHPEPLADGREFELTPGAARHLSRVLRLAPGDAFVVFDGSGREWPAELIAGSRARTGNGRPVERESPLAVTLIQGISRGEKMDDTIRKAVELGVTAIRPVFTERSEVRLTGARAQKRLEHWRGVVIAACEQSGRARVPALDAPVALDAMLRGYDGAPGLVLHPAAAAGLRDTPRPGSRVALLAGPEGGLSDAEVAAARAAGFTPARLGPRVLRTETAGPAAIAAVQALWGDFGEGV